MDPVPCCLQPTVCCLGTGKSNGTPKIPNIHKTPVSSCWELDAKCRPSSLADPSCMQLHAYWYNHIHLYIYYYTLNQVNVHQNHPWLPWDILPATWPSGPIFKWWLACTDSTPFPSAVPSGPRSPPLGSVNSRAKGARRPERRDGEGEGTEPLVEVKEKHIGTEYMLNKGITKV